MTYTDFNVYEYLYNISKETSPFNEEHEMLQFDKVCMYEEMMTNNDNVESSLLTSIY